MLTLRHEQCSFYSYLTTLRVNGKLGWSTFHLFPKAFTERIRSENRSGTECRSAATKACTKLNRRLFEFYQLLRCECTWIRLRFMLIEISTRRETRSLNELQMRFAYMCDMYLYFIVWLHAGCMRTSLTKGKKHSIFQFSIQFLS